MPMHTRAVRAAHRVTATTRPVSLAPFLALVVVVGALFSWGASAGLASSAQRHCCRGGSAGRAASLRGIRAPVGWQCATTGLALSAPTAIASGNDRPTVHAVDVEACSSHDSGPWSAGVAGPAHPVLPSSPPGLPGPSSRAPPVA